MEYIEIVTVASISLLLVLATYLLTKASSKDSSFRWIGLFLLLLALNFGDGLLALDGFYLEHTRLAGWEEAFVLLYGPLVLFFALHVTDPPFRWPARRWLHLLPFLVAELLIVIPYQSLPADKRLFLVDKASSMDPPIAVFALQLAALAHFIMYTLIAVRILGRHKETLKQQYSTVVVNWARWTVYYLLGLFALALAAMSVLQAGYPGLYLAFILVIVASTGLFIFFVLVQALDQPLLQIARHKATEFSLPGAEVDNLSAKIRDYFERDRGYANADLTIGDLADQLAEPVREISHVVNHHLARNFYDLVNGYRVNAAKEIFEAESATTVTDVMYRVGFNSKSSFNTQFKQKTGMTPSEYRRKARG